MTVQPITLNLPQKIYQQIKRAAEKAHRPLDEVLLEAIAAAAPVAHTVPVEMQSDLAHLAYLNDAALWQAARATMLRKQKERLEALHVKQQRESLTNDEQVEEQSLLMLYRETILVRAQAAVLLKQRGYNVADPQQFTPLG